MEDLKGIIAVETKVHQIFLKIYGIKYDRVGFVYHGYIHLFWVIPTSAKNFRGLYKDFLLKNCDNMITIYYGELSSKKSEDEYKNALAELDKKITVLSVPSPEVPLVSMAAAVPTVGNPLGTGFGGAYGELLEQYTKNEPRGIRYINRVFASLGIPETDLSTNIVIFPSLFDILRPFTRVGHVASESSSTVICTDLLDLLVRFPEYSLEIVEKRQTDLIKRTYKILSKLLSGLENRRLEPETISEGFRLQNYLRSFLTLPAREIRESGTNGSAGTDSLIIVEADQKISKESKSLRRIVEKMVDGRAPIDFSRLLEKLNYLLGHLQLDPIELEPSDNGNLIPHTWIIAITNGTTAMNDTVTKLKERGLIIPLSGQGIENLPDEELGHLIEYLEGHPLPSNPSGMNELRLRAVREYYQRKGIK